MTLFLQQFLNGIVLGAEYALFASGLALVFGAMRAFNFAYATCFVVSSYVMWVSAEWLHLPIFPVGVLLALISGALFSLLTERVAFWPFRRKNLDDYLVEAIATIAVSMIITNIVIIIWDASPLSFSTQLFPTPIKWAGLTISPILLIILFISIVLLGILAWFIQKTKAGKAIRATSISYNTARLLGINPERIRIYTFLAAGGLGAAAGVLMSLFFGMVSPGIADSLMMKAFAIVVIGGVGSVRGAAVVGLLLGIAESLTVSYMSGSMRDITAYGLLFLILIIRPHGLFGKSEVTRA